MNKYSRETQTPTRETNGTGKEHECREKLERQGIVSCFQSLLSLSLHVLRTSNRKTDDFADVTCFVDNDRLPFGLLLLLTYQKQLINMDPSLLREREAFKKRALSNPVVEAKKRKEREKEEESSKKRFKKDNTSTSNSSEKHKDLFARIPASSGSNFSIHAKIIKHMKVRFAQGDADALTLEELLDETNQLDISSRERQWLETEALRNNPKVEVTEDGKYAFKPAFRLRDRKGLHKLLDKYDREGKGGIWMEDIQESLPTTERAIKQLGDKVIVLTRQTDKRKVVFFNDKSNHLQVDEEFQKLWRSVAVDGIDEQKIEEYLTKQGITSMQDLGGPKKGLPIQKRKKPANRKNRNFKKTNDHVADILQDYSDKT